MGCQSSQQTHIMADITERETKKQESAIRGASFQDVVTRSAGQKFNEEYSKGEDIRTIDPESMQFRDLNGDLKE